MFAVTSDSGARWLYFRVGEALRVYFPADSGPGMNARANRAPADKPGIGRHSQASPSSILQRRWTSEPRQEGSRVVAVLAKAQSLVTATEFFLLYNQQRFVRAEEIFEFRFSLSTRGGTLLQGETEGPKSFAGFDK